MEYILLLIGLLAGGFAGFFYAKSQLSREFNAQIKEKDHELNIERIALGTVKGDNARMKEELTLSADQRDVLEERYQIQMTEAVEWKSRFQALEEKLADQKEEMAQLQEKFTKEFELVANKILEEKTNKFTDQNKKNLDEILLPLKERISEFQKKVEDTNEKNTERSAALDKHLKMLQELNQEITQETKSLTQALRGDSKRQGNWGEWLLESILAKAGLQKDVHYSKETNLKTEEGNNQRLDYIINLPDGKHVILDSKVSLTAYTNYVEAETETEEQLFLKQHLDSIHGHIKLLGSKDYQKLKNSSPDYVLMFVANEPALTLALGEDTTLFEKALDKNIVLVSSSTLLATLSTISYIWKQDLQNKNAEEIARQAGNLYDKFVGFTDDLVKLGNQMDTASKTYREAMNKMSEGTGNLTKRIQDLRKLGVNPSKTINQQLIDRSEEDD